MRVLVDCEYSGIVRDAFAKLGHDAWSCDLLPSERPTLFHIQGDAIEVAYSSHWDLMICHPPCTYLTNSGERWMKDNPDRQQQRLKAVDFAVALMNAPIEMIGMENPVGHLSSAYRKPDQIIHPWQFGHGETKTTCLWLKNLPPLKPTNIVPGREPRIHRMPPGKDRWKERSRTYTGIAEAMAAQWSAYAEQLAELLN